MKISNLSKSYQNTVVYSNFSLDIPDNKITCILGESGSGKTTLLNVLANLTPFVGDVPKIKCSYVFQDTRLVPNLTVKQNLQLVCKDEALIEKYLSDYGLKDKANAYPNTLSGGQTKRVDIIRAFLYQAPVMLLDEPFSSLDLKLKVSLMGDLKSALRKTPKTVVFVTHDVDEAVFLSDRVVVISNGKIILDEGELITPSSFGQNTPLREKLLLNLMK